MVAKSPLYCGGIVPAVVCFISQNHVVAEVPETSGLRRHRQGCDNQLEYRALGAWLVAENYIPESTSDHLSIPVLTLRQRPCKRIVQISLVSNTRIACDDTREVVGDTLVHGRGFIINVVADKPAVEPINCVMRDFVDDYVAVLCPLLGTL